MTPQRKDRSWCAERLQSLCEASGIYDAQDTGRRTRMLDFFFLPGRVSAKVQDDAGKLHRVELVFEQLNESAWEIVFSQIARRAYFFASILAGELPEEFENVLKGDKVSLCPGTMSEIEVLLNGEHTDEISESAPAAVFQRLIERLGTEPLVMFVLRGKGREEILVQVKRQRSMFDRPKFYSGRWVAGETAVVDREMPSLDPESFWRANPKIFELSYSIRADELPAAILKHLDPLPLGGLEEEVEPRLEEAYAQVARRAQAYGLGLK